MLLRGSSFASATGGAQTGHRAAVSYPGLVGHTDHAQASGEKFFDEIIFFVIECGAAEMADRSRVIDCCPVLPSDEGALTRLPGAFCYHVHRAIQRNFRPLFRARRAIFYFRLALRMSEQLIRRRTLWAKIPLANGTFRVALDRNQLPIFVINQLSTTHAAIWTNRARHFRSVDTSMHCTGLIGH